MELIMARETILSPSHYRLTAFLFSYYSPVKTRGAGVARGAVVVVTHCTFLYWKTSHKKKRRGSQNVHLTDTVTTQHGTIQWFTRCCSWSRGSTDNLFLFSTLFTMSQSRAELGIHVVQRFLGVKRLMQVAVTHACTPKANVHCC